ncbi:UpxY family transcription antiterminator [Danxiaibacter flavus]|uniref:UpxY family transcription antiterminator n=1 Tax=Danxiaibacter flavus TaxID=3049108 RepID=A0ABV3ZAI4_9BACT|nr:UpxY family transcription antiterminator [Chitinophagaceae bacterium DXS]
MSEEKKWYAIYTKPRWEKKVSALLAQKSLEAWCPVQKIRRQWSDRKKTVLEPLFKSYVFVHVSEKEKTDVLRTGGVVNFVYYLGKHAVIRQREIDTIKAYLLEEGAQISVESWESLAENIKVQVTQGVFMNSTGTVVRSSHKKVYVRLESLGQVMMVEFPVAHVERLAER